MSRTGGITDADVAARLSEHCVALASCNRCGFGANVRPIVSRARAPRAMLVGQAPGQVETGGGKPFAGRAGGTLFRWLERIGLDETTAREWLYISAITRCYPGPHPSGRGDRVPSPAERARCADWLDAELQIMRPPLIIPVGRLAIDRFLGPVALSAVVGQVQHVTHAGGASDVVPLPHPSGASSWIHQPGHSALLDRALELLRERLFVERDDRRTTQRRAG
ncbi:MAG TPA: uracil-DNA glycosylase family protein [Gemmatimonadaceae bacterium]|nr:uracil-DNA glycosylase family protein [Gemmatimonadaceae bacterium]